MTQTQTKAKADIETPQEPQAKSEIARFQPPRLPWHDRIGDTFKELGVDRASWKALVEAVFPAAKTVDAVVMALSYCRARKLDPFKRVVHIVPIWQKDKREKNPSTGRWEVIEKGRWVETVWPGIAEHRTTASRTRDFAGVDKAEFGPTVEHLFHVDAEDGRDGANVKVKFPEWCRITVYRHVHGQIRAFHGPMVYWLETYSRRGGTDIPNDMWQKRPFGQLEKCAEGAALRRAFPEELGDEPTAEEVGVYERQVEQQQPPAEARPRLDQFQEQPKPEPFCMVDWDGTEHRYDDHDKALDAFVGLIEKAPSRDALDGLWESNNLSAQLRDRGHADLADKLQQAFSDQSAKLSQPAAKPTEPVKIPPSPVGVKNPDWPAWITAFKARAQQLDAKGRAELLKKHSLELDFIAEHRTADHDAIQVLLDELLTGDKAK